MLKIENYDDLVNVYKSLCNHKLDEWHTVSDWIRGLLVPEGVEINVVDKDGKEQNNDVLV